MTTAKLALVIEDEPANQDFFVRLFRQAGFEVCAATTGQEALALAHQMPDLMLVAVDLQLPDVPGLELVEQLRGLLPGALLLVTTMWDEPDMISRAFENGCDVFLVKPHGFMELFRRLRELPAGRDQLTRVVIDQYGLRPYYG